MWSQVLSNQISRSGMKVCILSCRTGLLVVGVSTLTLFSVNVWAQAEPDPSNPPPVATITTIDGTATEQNALIDALPDTAELQVHRTGNLDDDESEPSETVVVSVIPKEIAADGEIGPGYYHVGQADTARAVIMDDEPRLNLPPTVAIVSPPPGAILPLHREIHILAEASDPDGWVAAVEFFAGGDSLGVAKPVRWSPEANSPTDALSDPNWLPPHMFRIRWTDPKPGTHVLTAVAEDDLGERAQSDPVEVHLLEFAEPMVVHVLASDPEGGEGPRDDTLAAIPDPARFTLVRSGSIDDPLEVFFELGGTAMNGMDYLELASTTVIPEGAHSVEVIVEPIDDLLAEPIETVTLTVVPPVCIEIFPPPPECYLVGTPSAARIMIRDNDPVVNEPPRIRVLNPHDGQVMRGPTDLQLTAAAWDGDGAVVAVEFFAGDRSLGVVTAPMPMPLGDTEDPSYAVPRYSLLWEDVPPGHYSLTALATDDDGATTASMPVLLWVVNPEEVQIVTVEATDAEATEPGDLTLDALDTGTFLIRRMGSVEHALTVYYRLSGTALNGIDYEELPHRAIIPAGETSVNVEVLPLHDGLAEGTEHAELRLLPICCLADADGTRPRPYIVGEPGSARVAILDIDAQGNVPPRIKLTRPVDGQVFIGPRAIELVAVARDPDGWVPTVHFYDGEELIGTSEIVFIREPDPGLPQTFSFTWAEVPPGRHELTAQAVDDDGARAISAPVLISVVHSEILPVVTIEAPDPRASEGGLLTVIDPAVFAVHRRGDLAEPLTVFYSIGGTAENGVDYHKLSGAVEIPAESSSATIEVIPIADNLEEDVETVILKLDAPMCPAIFPPPPGCYMVGVPGWAIAGIVDGPVTGNVHPKAEIVRPFPGTVYHAPANISVVAQARDRNGYVTLVEWFANDRKIGEQSMQFFTPPPPGELQVFEFSWQSVPAGDYLLTARATDDQGAVSALSEPIAVIVLAANDVPVVALFVADPLASERPNADGSRDTGTFRIRRSGPLDHPLAVFYQVSGTAENGVDYVTLGGHATIPAGSRWTRLTVLAVQDGLIEGPETVVVELVPSPALSPIEPYRVGSPHMAAVLILDEDDPSVPAQRIRQWLHLRLDAEPGAAYRLEVSEDLKQWQAVSDEWADDSGVHHIEMAPWNFPRRFYRLRPLASEVMENPEGTGRDW